MSDVAGRILVVDDVPENVRLLEAVLEPQGYEVVSATDGQAALELAESGKPDLVLLDVMMPELDGLAVCTRLREQPERSSRRATSRSCGATDGRSRCCSPTSGAGRASPTRSSRRS